MVFTAKEKVLNKWFNVWIYRTLMDLELKSLEVTAVKSWDVKSKSVVVELKLSLPNL